MFSLLLILFIALSAKADETNHHHALLTGLGADIRTLEADGILSATGQPIQGMSFNVELDTAGAYLLTMGGPFGITAAKMYAAADSFVMVNYLMQEVWYGNPNSPSLKAASHLPLPASELMSLLRGRVPGNVTRFSYAPRNAVNALFTCSDSAGVEYVLVDTTRMVILQYQRKDSTGAMLLDVAFQDYTMVDSVALAHTLIIRAPQSKQQATLTIRSAKVNEPLDGALFLSPPASFERRRFD